MVWLKLFTPFFHTCSPLKCSSENLGYLPKQPWSQHSMLQLQEEITWDIFTTSYNLDSSLDPSDFCKQNEPFGKLNSQLSPSHRIVRFGHLYLLVVKILISPLYPYASFLSVAVLFHPGKRHNPSLLLSTLCSLRHNVNLLNRDGVRSVLHLIYSWQALFF